VVDTQENDWALMKTVRALERPTGVHAAHHSCIPASVRVSDGEVGTMNGRVGSARRSRTSNGLFTFMAQRKLDHKPGVARDNPSHKE
jgi:hypothetical protein